MCPRALTKQLKEFEVAGLIARQVYAEVPPKVENRLKKKGKSLRPIVQALEKWGARYALPTAPTKVRSA